MVQAGRSGLVFYFFCNCYSIRATPFVNQGRLERGALATKTGTKKSFISRIENGKRDIQLSTLYRILELGLGKKISFTIE